MAAPQSAIAVPRASRSSLRAAAPPRRAARAGSPAARAGRRYTSPARSSGGDSAYDGDDDDPPARLALLPAHKFLFWMGTPQDFTNRAAGVPHKTTYVAVRGAARASPCSCSRAVPFTPRCCRPRQAAFANLPDNEPDLYAVLQSYHANFSNDALPVTPKKPTKPVADLVAPGAPCKPNNGFRRRT